MNIDQNNPYPIYLGVGLLAASLGCYFLNRMVTYCKKEKTQASNNLQDSEKPKSTALIDREPKTQDTAGLTPLQTKLQDYVHLFEGEHYIQASNAIQSVIENKEINDDKTLMFLYNLINEQLIKTESNINNVDHSPADKERMKEKYHLITYTLLELIQLNKINDSQVLSELVIYLIKTLNGTNNLNGHTILRILISLSKCQCPLNDEATKKIQDFFRP